MLIKNRLALALHFFFLFSCATAQYRNFHTVDVQVDFDQHLRAWDGFGVTYVQTAHTSDYEEYPQEYGGFSILDEHQKEEIIEMIFGDQGLKPGIAKIFLDPLHLSEPGGAYNHELSTRYALEFYERGLALMEKEGRQLSMITTLYGPPAFMTKQNKMRGRDFNPERVNDLVNYCIDWTRFLREEKQFPVDYFSLHNEGDDWRRWPNDGVNTNFDHGHDYNLYWSPNMVADMMPKFRAGFRKNGLSHVGITPGETQNWFKFYFWGYADSIVANPEALSSLNLITSHGFNGFTYGRWFSGTSNQGADLIRSKRPELKAWVTSDSWGRMDVDFIANIWVQIYQCKINGFIPWAVIQRPTNWVNNDPNPGTAIIVDEDGSYRVTKGYHYYKLLTRAGQPGTQVAKTFTNDSELLPLAFAAGDDKNTDAFVLINTGITATYRADMLQIENGKKRLQFSLTDPTKNGFYERENHLKLLKTEGGYNIEFTIAAEEIDPDHFDIIAFDGENSTEGIIGWNKQGKIAFDENRKEKNIAFVPSTNQTPLIDGEKDLIYNTVDNRELSDKRHSATSPVFNARWSAVKSGDEVCFFVEITDPTNYQERSVRLTFKGTPYKKFIAYRTSPKEDYEHLGAYELDEQDIIIYQCPPSSVTTFFGIK